MNLPTILISLVLIGLFALAARFLAKNGTCAVCAEKGACQSAGAAAGCGGSCASCHYCEAKTTVTGH